MSKVFVVNEPTKFNADRGERTRAIDLRPAQKYGELVFMSSLGEPPLDPTAWLARMYELAITFDFNTDYLLPVGHPALIVGAAALLGGRMLRDEHLYVLVWQGREIGYAPVRLPLFANRGNQTKPTHPQSPENV